MQMLVLMLTIITVHSSGTETILAHKCILQSPISYPVLPDAPWPETFAAEAAERLPQIVMCVKCLGL